MDQTENAGCQKNHGEFPGQGSSQIPQIFSQYVYQHELLDNAPYRIKNQYGQNMNQGNGYLSDNSVNNTDANTYQ